jgi:polyisoprenyl-teichoic acid--peptidoglycan teichoic acid transferase
VIFRRRYDGPPRLARAMLLRAGLAGFLVIGLSATAVATSVILEVDRVKNIFTQNGRQAISIPEVTAAEAGGPRTILVLGSDQRYQDKKLGLKPRSDTMLLIRINPRTNAISVLSVPRDLRVEIPGHGADKVNAAFEDGGPRLTVRTIQTLFKGVTHRPFPINNVIVVNFGSFKAAVNYIHGVYVDVDRRYFNDHTGPGGYAAIDIQPGYQKLIGQDALDYVRYRHTDNDIVRAARQQDFLRQARNAAGFKRLLSIGNRDKLARVFSKYFQFDRSFLKTQQIFSLLKLGLFVAERHPGVEQIRFPFYEAPNPAINTFLYYHAADLRKAVNQFMNAKGPKPGSSPKPPSRNGRHGSTKLNLAAIPGLNDARSVGEDQAVLAQPKAHFPVFFPSLRYNASSYDSVSPRVYTIRDETGKRHRAYRLVLSTGVIGQYYGIQGMTWKSPPILDNPDQIRRIGGRRMLIYLDRKRVRLVAWRTRRAVYWVSNTLTQTLNRPQMLGIAASMRRLKG